MRLPLASVIDLPLEATLTLPILISLLAMSLVTCAAVTIVGAIVAPVVPALNEACTGEPNWRAPANSPTTPWKPAGITSPFLYVCPTAP